MVTPGYWTQSLQHRSLHRWTNPCSLNRGSTGKYIVIQVTGKLQFAMLQDVFLKIIFLFLFQHTFFCTQQSRYTKTHQMHSAVLTLIEALMRDFSFIDRSIFLNRACLFSKSWAYPPSLRLTDSHTPPVKSTNASPVLPASRASYDPANLFWSKDRVWSSGYQRAWTRLEFQYVLWVSISHILLQWDNYTLYFLFLLEGNLLGPLQCSP